MIQSRNATSRKIEDMLSNKAVSGRQILFLRRFRTYSHHCLVIHNVDN